MESIIEIFSYEIFLKVTLSCYTLYHTYTYVKSFFIDILIVLTIASCSITTYTENSSQQSLYNRLIS